MQHMHDRVIFHPLKGKILTKKNKWGSLQVLMFPKKKTREKKGRAVIDGRKQRNES